MPQKVSKPTRHRQTRALLLPHISKSEPQVSAKVTATADKCDKFVTSVSVRNTRVWYSKTCVTGFKSPSLLLWATEDFKGGHQFLELCLEIQPVIVKRSLTITQAGFDQQPFGTFLTSCGFRGSSPIAFPPSKSYTDPLSVQPKHVVLQSDLPSSKMDVAPGTLLISTTT